MLCLVISTIVPAEQKRMIFVGLTLDLFEVCEDEIGTCDEALPGFGD